MTKGIKNKKTMVKNDPQKVISAIKKQHNKVLKTQRMSDNKMNNLMDYYEELEFSEDLNKLSLTKGKMSKLKKLKSDWIEAKKKHAEQMAGLNDCIGIDC